MFWTCLMCMHKFSVWESSLIKIGIRFFYSAILNDTQSDDPNWRETKITFKIWSFKAKGKWRKERNGKLPQHISCFLKSYHCLVFKHSPSGGYVSLVNWSHPLYMALQGTMVWHRKSKRLHRHLPTTIFALTAFISSSNCPNRMHMAILLLLAD